MFKKDSLLGTMCFSHWKISSFFIE